MVIGARGIGRLILVKTAARLPPAAARAIGLRALPARRGVARAEGFHVVKARGTVAAAAAPARSALRFRDLDAGRRQLVEKTRGDRGRPGAVNAPVGGEIEFGAAARPGQAD